MSTPLRSNAVRLAVSFAAALAVVGCGGDDDASTDATVEVSVAAPSTEAVETTGAVETTEGTSYTSAEGDYSVEFPGEPTEQVQSQPLPDGSVVDIVFAGYEFDDSYIATARTEYPDTYTLDPALALQGAQDEALANVGGTLIASADIALQGRPGKEFSATVTSGGQTGTLLQRVYLDGLVSYQQIFTGAGEATFTDSEVAPFFESFAFTTG